MQTPPYMGYHDNYGQSGPYEGGRGGGNFNQNNQMRGHHSYGGGMNQRGGGGFGRGGKPFG